MTAQTIVYYHDNCTDGFGAAFVVYKLYGVDNVMYVPCQYGKPTPLQSEYEGKEIVIVDFSFPLETMADMQAKATRFTWLDHHKTAFEAINKNPDIIYSVHSNTVDIILDTSRSGALLAFDWFFGRANLGGAPAIIKYIDDRDRWQFKMEKTREFHAAMQASKPWSFEQWDSFDAKFHSELGELDRFIDMGATILQIERKQIKSSATKAGQCIVWDRPGLAVNATMHISEIGHELANASGTYGLIYFIDEKGDVKCSLRSNGDYDVSLIAKNFGGGGHKNAAGFSTDLNTLKQFLNA